MILFEQEEVEFILKLLEMYEMGNESQFSVSYLWKIISGYKKIPVKIQGCEIIFDSKEEL